MGELTFVIPGQPTAKARARACIRGGKIHHYTPAKTTDYESRVRYHYLRAGGRRMQFDGGPIKIHITALLPQPARGIKIQPGSIYAPKKPDWDNIGKIICDALNGLAYSDDAKICDGRVVKHYAGETPLVSVTIGNLNQ
jgi:Holliday junction resolvase RusA-like endonuclease